VHDDLIVAAEMLATVDARRPKQANLRRAVSTAYYALFHFLIDEACRLQLGSHHAQRAFRHTLARAYTHTVMKQACVSYSGGTLKDAVTKALPKNQAGKYVIPKTIQELADLFVELQESRHAADYDLARQFNRTEVLILIRQVRARMADFRALPATNDRCFFLSCLWAWKELTNR
jgi:uncharacterized protein (UPF0332 family)